MKPSEKYDHFLQQSGFNKDPMQQRAIKILDSLSEEIVNESSSSRGVMASIKALFGNKQCTIKGVYFWGGVGRGKTFIMDIFFQTLAIKNKKRIHFHHFMKNIHDELTKLKNTRNPVKLVAKQFASEARILCVDEFVVTDIGDAMLIGRLLEALFDEGVILLATSNMAPDDLYKDGLQRTNFIPAIKLLKAHCQIFNLEGGKDYRTLSIKQTGLYQYPHDEQALKNLTQYVDTHLIADHSDDHIMINGRAIHFEFCAEDTIWFSFEALCKSTRSRLDYLEIAQEFNTMILTGIEQMDKRSNDVARRFISLIDILYDHRVNLLCTAEVAATELYTEGGLAFEFERTVSRLIEMQSKNYLGKSHRLD